MSGGRASRRHDRNLVLLFVVGAVGILCVLAVTLVLGIQEPSRPPPPASSGQPEGVSGSAQLAPTAQRQSGGLPEPLPGIGTPGPGPEGGISEPPLTHLPVTSSP